MNYPLLYLFIAVVLVRFSNLTQSLWLDEAITVNVAEKFSATQIITQFSPNDFHPPLYYLFMDLWINLFGSSEVAVRFPSVLFCLIAGYFVYKTGKLIGSASIGFYSAAFFLFNPLIVYYSQEARMYMMVTALVSCAIYLFLKLVRSEHKKTDTTLVIGLSTVLGLCFLTFYGSVFFIAAVFVWLFVKRKYRLLLKLLPGVLLLMALVSPLLFVQFNHAQGGLVLVKNWDLVLGIPSLKNAALLPLKFVTGRISFEPKLLYYALGAVSTAIVWFYVARGANKWRTVAFLGGTTLAIAFVFSFATPLFQYFRFLFVVPLFSLLLGYGTRVFQWERNVILGIFFIFSSVYLFIPLFHREDWKHVLVSVPAIETVYMIPSATDPIQYYYPDREVKNLFEIESMPPTKKNIFVIPYTADIYGFPYTTFLQKQGYTLDTREDYRGVTLESWKK